MEVQVRPTQSLHQLVRDIQKGYWSLPAGVSPFSWTKGDVENYMNGLLAEVTSASFIVWQLRGRQQSEGYAADRIGPIPMPESCQAIALNGMNRLTTLAWALRTDLHVLKAEAEEAAVWLAGETLVYDVSHQLIRFVPDDQSNSETCTPLADAFAVFVLHSKQEHELNGHLARKKDPWLLMNAVNVLAATNLPATEILDASMEQSLQYLQAYQAMPGDIVADAADLFRLRTAPRL